MLDELYITEPFQGVHAALNIKNQIKVRFFSYNV